MTVRNRTIRGVVSSEHNVQFFDTDESKAKNVAAFLAQGYDLGEPLMVVARPASWMAISQQLEALGVRVQEAIGDGMLAVHDADETLRRLSRGGTPDPALYDKTVGHALTTLARKGRVRAYGEMVDILAQRGDLKDAVRLEGFWNDLSARAPIFLMCGYSAAHFVSTSTQRALLEICKAHSGVHRDLQDPLGEWLLTAAHNGAASSCTLRH
jgi:hypothetical protein